MRFPRPIRLVAPAFAAALAAAALAAACGRGATDPVQGLLAGVEAAAERRDVEGVAGFLSEQYRDHHGLGRVETTHQLERWLAGYESVALEVYGTEVERGGDASARVRCVVEFSGRGRRAFGLDGLLPPAATYRFTLDLTEERGRWVVRGAAYEPVDPAGEPPVEPAERGAR
jgi:hypothetical protein